MNNDDEIFLNNGENHDNEINTIQLKLNPFWANSPVTWFIQTESLFNLSRVTRDISKYNHVVTSLPQDVAESVADLLENPPENQLYESLKKALIERHSLSIERRIQKLISGEEMGDKRPSEFYRTLKQLAGSSGTVGDELIKKIWVSRLPNLINISLIPHKDDNIAKSCEVADQIWEALQTCHNISAIDNSIPTTSHLVQSNCASNTQNDKSRVECLERQILELKLIISEIKTDRNRGRSRARTLNNNYRNRSQSGKRFNDNGKFCWYHFRYRDRATKCIPPCQFKVTSTNLNQSN